MGKAALKMKMLQSGAVLTERASSVLLTGLGWAEWGRLWGRVVFAACFIFLSTTAFIAAFTLYLAPSTATAQVAVAYTYDTLGRVIVADYGNGKKIIYTYDPAGNRLTTLNATAVRFSITAASATEGGVVTFTVTKSGR